MLRYQRSRWTPRIKVYYCIRKLTDSETLRAVVILWYAATRKRSQLDARVFR